MMWWTGGDSRGSCPPGQQRRREVRATSEYLERGACRGPNTLNRRRATVSSPWIRLNAAAQRSPASSGVSIDAIAAPCPKRSGNGNPAAVLRDVPEVPSARGPCDRRRGGRAVADGEGAAPEQGRDHRLGRRHQRQRTGTANSRTPSSVRFMSPPRRRQCRAAAGSRGALRDGAGHNVRGWCLCSAARGRSQAILQVPSSPSANL